MSGVLCRLVSLATWLGVFIVLVCSDGELRFSVVEEMPAGTFVGNIILGADLPSQHDADTLRQFRYGILPPPGEIEVSLFTVDETEGIISTKAQVDREQLCPHKAECSIYLDVTVSGPDNILTIGVLVDIVDINDNKPSFPEPKITLEIPESAVPGISFNLPLATDLDSPLLSIQTYELVPSPGIFKLNVISVGNVPRSLQLVLTDRLDREQREFYQVTLMAYDGDQPPRTGSLTIDVVIGDANDHGPEFVKTSYEITVLEDYTVEKTILTVQAHDQDTGINGQISYHIAPGADSNTMELFGVVESTGEIFVREPLDYEKQKEYDLVVEARDGGENSQPAYTAVTIHVEDVNDNAPQITVNTHSEGNTAEILETAEVGTFVAHFLVRDQDAGRNGNFSCNLQEPHFHLRQQDGSQYRLVTAAGLDRETQEHFQLTIKCQDYGLPSLTSSVEISVHVLDANDNSPMFSQQSYSVNILENNHMDAFIVDVNASDLDEGENAEITYQLGPEVAEYFKIDSESGIIRTNAVFDYEKMQEKAFLVYAVDGGSPPRSSSVLVHVSVLDTNDEAPQFSQRNYDFEILENQPSGIEIGIVSAVDPDSEPFSHFEFSLAPGGSADLFDIDAESGQLITRAALDREEQSVYFVTVVASNTGDTVPLSSSATITVQVLDSNDNAPIITFPSADNHTVAVSNKVPVGYQITQVEAFDVDQGSNAALKYAMNDRGQDTGFYIDSSTGVVATAVGLQHLDTQVFEVEIIVTDLGFPPKVSKQILKISVNRSMAYDGHQDQLLSSTNLTIVIALAVSCGTVVLILIVAIVILRSHEKNKQKQKPTYQCHIEAQKIPEDAENKENDDNNKRQMQGHTVSSNKMEKSVNVDLALQYGNSNSLQPWPPGVSPVAHEVDLKATAPPKPPRMSAGSIQNPTLTLTSNPGQNQNKPWEISIRELQVQQKTVLNTSRDGDTDSAYSGDVSNADSGRGHSEEGENHSQGIPCGSCPGREHIHRSSGRWAPDLFSRTQAGVHYPDLQQGALSNHTNFKPNGLYHSNCRLSGRGHHGYGGILKNGCHSNQQSSSKVPNLGENRAPSRDSFHSYPVQTHPGHKHGVQTVIPGQTKRDSQRRDTRMPSGGHVIDISDVNPDVYSSTSYKSVVV